MARKQFGPGRVVKSGLGILLILGALALRADEPVSVLLERGIYTEETKGDLDGAITIYRQVIDQAVADRALAAQAQFRLGMCYLKTKREAEAADAFRALIGQYPDQGDLVAQARAHLPAPEFPEFEGSRVKETVHLSLAPKPNMKGVGLEGTDLPASVRAVPEQSYLVFNWRFADNAPADAQYAVKFTLRPADADPDQFTLYVWHTDIDPPQISDSYAYGPVLVDRTVNKPPDLGGDPFVNDPPLLGRWESVDFVDAPDAFDPQKRQFSQEFYLKEMTFYADGYTEQPFWTWTRGTIYHTEDKTKAHYEIREADEGTYLFMAWMSGDVTQRGQKPKYYVLRKAQALLQSGEYILEAHAYDMTGTLGIGRARLRIEELNYTQIQIAEMQPDGTKTFRSIMQQINRSDEILASNRFMNSDFIELEKMTDAQDRPLEFTSQHVGNNYHYELKLNDPVMPGRVLLTSSEGRSRGRIKSVAGQADTFEYSMQHWPSAGRPTRRVEIYTLPGGAEFLESTPPDMPRRERDGRTELYHEELIPKDGSITTAFRYRLAGAQLAAAEKSLELLPAPWADGERMKLDLKAVTGMSIGSLTYTARIEQHEGRPAWRIQCDQVVTIADSRQITNVLADEDTFAPITGYTKNQMGEFKAEYVPQKVKLTITGPDGKTTEKGIETEGVAYDNEQALYVIRRLPLAENYHASFPIFPVQGGVVVECRIDVLARESVTVPLGTFDCFKLNLEVHAGGQRALQHQLWFSADEHHYLVKYDAGSATMELVEAGVPGAAGGEATFAIAELGITLHAPAGWSFANLPSKKLQLLPPPDLEADCFFDVELLGNRSSEAASIHELARQGAEKPKQFFKAFTVREDSWTSGGITAMPAARYIADYELQGKPMIEYCTYLMGVKNVYWFVFRIAPDKFEAARPAFDAIVAGLDAGDDARPAEERARAAEPHLRDGWRLRGEGKHAEAEAAFRLALAENPNDANAWNGLGWSQFNQGMAQSGKASFEQCLALEPRHAAALNGLGWIAKGEGKTDEALAHWRKAVEATPFATAAWSGLAETYMALGRTSDAIDAYEQWLRVDPANQELKQNLERAWRQGPPADHLSMNETFIRIVQELEDATVFKNFSIDLDTGTVITPKPDDGFEMGDEASMTAWFRKLHADAMGKPGEPFMGLIGFDMIVAPITKEQWDLNADDLRRIISPLGPRTPAMMSGKEGLPATFAFKTREGSLGVLQILELEKGSSGHVKIQYKLLAYDPPAAGG